MGKASPGEKRRIAFKKGVDAYHAGDEEIDNPYSMTVQPVEWTEWQNGWEVERDNDDMEDQ